MSSMRTSPPLSLSLSLPLCFCLCVSLSLLKWLVQVHAWEMPSFFFQFKNLGSQFIFWNKNWTRCQVFNHFKGSFISRWDKYHSEISWYWQSYKSALFCSTNKCHLLAGVQQCPGKKRFHTWYSLPQSRNLYMRPYAYWLKYTLHCCPSSDVTDTLIVSCPRHQKWRGIRTSMETESHRVGEDRKNPLRMS